MSVPENTVQTYTDPVHRTLTDRELALLSQIFRLILKEIRGEEDLTLLAPGELGINYTSGSFYIRNPHNGKIFSPNSMELVNLLLAKFNAATNVLNADRINDVAVYVGLADLDPLPTTYFTPDGVIRQMHSPGIFFGPIEYEENYRTLGWPSGFGMCMVYKVSEEHVYIKFFDGNGYNDYEGHYNSKLHQFEGWGVDDDATDFSADSIGGGDVFDLFIDGDIYDFVTIMVTVTEELNAEARVTINSGPARPLVDWNGDVLTTPIAANNVIMLTYDEENQSWVVSDSTESATSSIVRILRNRIIRTDANLENAVDALNGRIDSVYTELTEKIEGDESDINGLKEQVRNLQSTVGNMQNVISSMGNSISALQDTVSRQGGAIAQLMTDPGNIQASVVNYVADSNGVTEIADIDGFDGTIDKLVVNYGQTILKIGLDYEVVDNGVRLLNGVVLASGDVVQFIVLKQVDHSE